MAGLTHLPSVTTFFLVSSAPVPKSADFVGGAITVGDTGVQLLGWSGQRHLQLQHTYRCCSWSRLRVLPAGMRAETIRSFFGSIVLRATSWIPWYDVAGHANAAGVGIRYYRRISRISPSWIVRRPQCSVGIADNGAGGISNLFAVHSTLVTYGVNTSNYVTLAYSRVVVRSNCRASTPAEAVAITNAFGSVLA